MYLSLLLDGSKTSVKAVLLNLDSKIPSIPVAFSNGMKEEYNAMQKILTLINYQAFKLKIVADLKVITMLMGLQSGYTKYPCFLCLWDSRAYCVHWSKNEWPVRTGYEINEYNVKHAPLVDPDDIILPALHIKLGIMRVFVKALGDDHPAIDFLHNMFPTLSRLKITEGIFVGKLSIFIIII